MLGKTQRDMAKIFSILYRPTIRKNRAKFHLKIVKKLCLKICYYRISLISQ